MSTDLTVKINKPIETERLKEKISVVFHILIPLISKLNVLMEQRTKAGIQSLQATYIGHEELEIVVRSKQYSEAVGLTIYSIPTHPKIAENQSGYWAGISVAAMRTPLEYIFAASVAASISYLTESQIIDDALAWSEVESRSPENFIQAIQLKKDDAFDMEHLYAKKIYASLPIANS